MRIVICREGKSVRSACHDQYRKLLKRCKDCSKGDTYETIFEAFQNCAEFRKSMIDGGHNGESIKALDELAITPGQHKPMPYKDRVARWEGQHVVVNKLAGNLSGGSATKARDAPEFKDMLADRKALLKRNKEEEEEPGYQPKWEPGPWSASSSSGWRTTPTQVRGLNYQWDSKEEQKWQSWKAHKTEWDKR